MSKYDYRALTFREKKKIITPGLIKEIISWIFYTAVAIFSAFVLVLAFGLQIRVMGDSMEPTLPAGSNVLVNKLAFQVGRPARGDVVAFRPNGNEKAHYYIKRVMAIPGDQLQIINGDLYVNGDKQELPGNAILSDAGIAQNKLVLDAGEYFVLGDNPDSGEDSRSANLGPIQLELMVGKVWFLLGEENRLVR